MNNPASERNPTGLRHEEIERSSVEHDFSEERLRTGDGGGRRESAEPVPGLLRQLMADVATLFRKELALAASEINQSVTEARHGASSMVSGGAVLFAGVLFLLGAAAAALALVMAAWAALLIVGGVVAIIGLIMVKGGQKKLAARSFAPDRTVESLRKDKEAIGGRRHEPQS